MEGIESKGYWDSRMARRAAEIKSDAEYAGTTLATLENLERRLNLMYADSAAYTDADRQAVEGEIKAIRATMQQTENDEWTREATMQRRASMNAAVQNPANRTGKTVLIGKIERTLGFGRETLKRQIARHGL